MPGPSPMPAELQEHLGWPGHRKHLQSEAFEIERLKVGSIPSHLDDAGAARWLEIVDGPALLWLSESDRGALTRLCELEDIRCRAKEELDIDGLVVDGTRTGSTKVNAAWPIYRDCSSQIATLEDRLGLNTIARTKAAVGRVQAASGSLDISRKLAEFAKT